MKSPIDIEFDNISVKADHFTKLVYVPPSGNFSLFQVLAGLAVVGLVLLIGWWIFRRSQ